MHEVVTCNEDHQSTLRSQLECNGMGKRGDLQYVVLMSAQEPSRKLKLMGVERRR